MQYQNTHTHTRTQAPTDLAGRISDDSTTTRTHSFSSTTTTHTTTAKMFGSTSALSKPANKRIFGVFAGLALATQANAHLFIQYPAAPMEGPIKSPLMPDGSDFPCHNAPIQSSGGLKMAAGSSQLLQFDDGGGANTATHGGGSWFVMPFPLCWFRR